MASKELRAFSEHFQKLTGIKPHGTEEHKDWYHWKRLIFHKLECDQILDIALYLRQTFSVPGKNTHNLPMLAVYDGQMALTVDVSLIKKYIIK